MSLFPNKNEEMPANSQLFDSAITDHHPIFDHMTRVARNEKYPGELNNPKGIAIDPNTQEIYVVQNNPACISIFTSFGEFIKVIVSEHTRDPWGIAIHGNDIYLTDIVSHFVIHFKKETTGIHFVGKKGGYGNIIGKFRHPKQLTISSRGDIFVADSCNNRVQILFNDLHYQRQISHHSIEIPEDITLTAEEVYVLCWGSPCMHVFSYAGEKIRSLIMSYYSRCFFCLDSFENIFITNRTTNQINIYARDGTYLSTLGEQGNTVVSIQNPHGIVLIDGCKLAVVSSSPISLFIFS